MPVKVEPEGSEPHQRHQTRGPQLQHVEDGLVDRDIYNLTNTPRTSLFEQREHDAEGCM